LGEGFLPFFFSMAKVFDTGWVLSALWKTKLHDYPPDLISG
jgi:hypothetical protein